MPRPGPPGPVLPFPTSDGVVHTPRINTHTQDYQPSRLLSFYGTPQTPPISRTALASSISNGGLPLHGGTLQVVTYLLQMKAAVDRGDSHGRTPLHVGAQKGSISVYLAFSLDPSCNVEPASFDGFVAASRERCTYADPRAS